MTPYWWLHHFGSKFVSDNYHILDFDRLPSHGFERTFIFCRILNYDISNFRISDLDSFDNQHILDFDWLFIQRLVDYGGGFGSRP